MFTYRNESYGEQTVDFYYDTASIAHFSLTKESSTVDGIIELHDKKVGLRIQTVSNNGALKNGAYYESNLHEN